MRLSVAIVNWNSSNLLNACVRSISCFPPSEDYEVIVVDNASSDFDEKRFRDEFPNVKLIVNNDNAGYARGNNQAIELSTGDYVLLLNPDTEVTENALDALIRFMDEHTDAGATGAKLVRPNGTIDRSVRSFPYPGPITWELLGLSRLFPRSRTFGAYRMTFFGYDRAIEVDQPMGSCLIISRRMINETGLMDENFPIFFNEVDWLYRAKMGGYKVYFTPDATIIHHGAGSTSKAGRRKMSRESHLSLARFYAKHFKGKIPAPVYYFSIACINFRCWVLGVRG